MADLTVDFVQEELTADIVQVQMSVDVVQVQLSVDFQQVQMSIDFVQVVLSVDFIGGGDTLPVVDSRTIVKGSEDPTKLLRFEVDQFTSGETRVISFKDRDYVPADDAEVLTPEQYTRASLLDTADIKRNTSFIKVK